MSNVKRNVLGAIILVAGFASTSIAQVSSEQTLARLAWMSGCWQRAAGARIVEEQWMTPRSTIMLGMSRTVNNGKLVEYEQIRLSADGERVTYSAAPSGQSLADFQSTHVSDSLLVVGNPRHDFPQVISYRRISRDSLLARIEGPMNGSTRAINFPYGRVPCPGSP